MEPTEAEKKMIDERLDAHRDNPDAGSSWEEVYLRITRKLPAFAGGFSPRHGAKAETSPIVGALSPIVGALADLPGAEPPGKKGKPPEGGSES